MKRLWWGAIFSALTLNAACAQQMTSMIPEIHHKRVEEIFSSPDVQALARAACKGDARKVESYVAKGVDPRSTDSMGYSVLHVAADCQSVAGVKALLKAGADPNQPFSNGFSPVLTAAYRGPPELLKVLLEHGGSPNAVDRGSNYTALNRALAAGKNKGEWDNYYLLLDTGANINWQDEGHKTIAETAVAFNQFDKVSELLDRGYDHDLETIGLYAQNSVNLTSSAEQARARLIEKLKQRGVKFPIPKRPLGK